jgi:very-short-patch-repair endonuclease
VFALGHAALRPEGWWTAALLASGAPAVLSCFHVTTTRRSGRVPATFTLHRVRSLTPDEVIVHRGFPCTTVLRTIVDLADLLPLRDVQRLIESADALGMLDAAGLVAAADRAVGRRGRGKLIRASIAYRPRPRGTRSELEARFVDLCRRHRLPAPLVNTWVDGKMVDFAWPSATLIVETDGWEHHRSRGAFGRDRTRDADLAVAGWQVLRFTWAEVDVEPRRVVAKIRAIMARRVAQASPDEDQPTRSRGRRDRWA